MSARPHHARRRRPNVAPALDLDADSSTTGGADYLTGSPRVGPAVAIVDTDVLISDADGTKIVSATITLTNPQTDDLLAFSGPPHRHQHFRLRSGHRYSDPEQLGVAPNYETALQQIQFSNSNTPVDRHAHHQHRRQRRHATATRHMRSSKWGRSTMRPRWSTSILTTRAARFAALSARPSPRTAPRCHRRSRYPHHRCRQHQPCFGDVTLTNPQTDDLLAVQRGAAGRDYRLQLQPRHRYPHAHRLCLARSTTRAALQADSTSATAGDNPADGTPLHRGRRQRRQRTTVSGATAL